MFHIFYGPINSLMLKGIRLINMWVYQDNQNSVLLETNGKKYSGNRTIHMNISYFFIKYRVNSGEVTISCFATREMVADHFTKT